MEIIEKNVKGTTEYQVKATLTTPIGRVSFPHLVTPSKQNDKFEITLLFDKEKKDELKNLGAAVNALRVKKFGKDEAKDKKSPIKDGDILYADAKPDSKQWNEQNQGHFVLTATKSTDKPVTVVGQDGKSKEDPSKVYAGCYARMQVVFRTYTGFGGGVTCYLAGVQFIKDGEPFGGGVSFDAVDDVDFTGEMVELDDAPDF